LEQQQQATPEEYEKFFRLVDSLLWDSGEEEEETGRKFRRGQ
jgi:hypothetical protein